MFFDLAGGVSWRPLLHKPEAASGTHRCLRQRVQRQSRALRLDQEKGLSAPFQRPPYHSALIPGTSVPQSEEMCESVRRIAVQRERIIEKLQIQSMDQPTELADRLASCGKRDEPSLFYID